MRVLGLSGLLLVLSAAAVPAAEEPVALFVGGLVVAPSHLPPVPVWVENRSQEAYEGTITLKVPEGWQFSPAQEAVTLAPGETKRVPFTITKGAISEANSYPIEVSATGAGTTVTRRQEVACCSAPYFKPSIDGDPAEWKDAIPVTFLNYGKRTVISTYWNRSQFCLLVAVEEDKLVPMPGEGQPAAFDALQVAISPQDTQTGASPDEESTRYEFLFVASGDGSGKCFQLAEPGMKLADTQERRALAGLELDKAEVAASRKHGITYYECAVPFRSLREIRPSEGREFFLSVLVHDPDGTGVRDWGEAAGLWPWKRNPLAWSRWPGAAWGDQPPLDNKLPWGLCSSKY